MLNPRQARTIEAAAMLGALDIAEYALTDSEEDAFNVIHDIMATKNRDLITLVLTSLAGFIRNVVPDGRERAALGWIEKLRAEMDRIDTAIAFNDIVNEGELK